MVLAGQAIRFPASLQTMRYDEIKQHIHGYFRGQLVTFKERLAASGPDANNSREVFETALAIADGPFDDFAAMHDFGSDGSMLAKFLEERGLGQNLPPETIRLVAGELQKAYSAALKTALGHAEALQPYDFEDHPPAPAPLAAPTADLTPQPSADLLSKVAKRYLDESQRLTKLRPKTLSEKRDALDLLQEIIGDKPVSTISKADARKADEVLQRLPKNRGKSATTRNLSLSEMLALPGVETISARTLNSYVSHFQAFMSWVGKKWHTEDNPFQGFRVKVAASSATDERKPFKPEHLRTLYLHLTDNPNGLVRKDDHKWPTLIAMFSGARLNEVCQLRVEDVQDRNGILCFDFNDDDEKALKNIASRRVVPIHARLIDLGVLDFIEQRKREQAPRLFPSLTYSKQNGWGRNVGRWFNESLLPSLGMKDKGLVFHSFRHSMVTTLGQHDVQESIIKAIVGHTRSGVTQSVYNKEGYKPEQLKREGMRSRRLNNNLSSNHRSLCFGRE